jgi:cobalt-zinc-cadmium efflux system outer membrane protein
MRKVSVLLLLALGGCRACPGDGPVDVEGHIAAVAPVRVISDSASSADSLSCEVVGPSAPHGPLDLATVWDLALANNPLLREAAADVEAARGRLIQAGLYPNPRFLYDENTIGSQIASQGNIVLQVNQDVVTAGKRRLDMAVASRETDVAFLALLGRKFEVLTRVRRAFYDYVGWVATVTTNEEIVTVLEQGLKITRRLVEEVKTRPQTDLLRIEALLEEAQINLARSRAIRDGAWRQLAAEVGVRELPLTQTPVKPARPCPDVGCKVG